MEVICPDGRCADDRVPLPPQRVRILLISQAPPLRPPDSYFYFENTPNRLRNGLFEILRMVGYGIHSISDFGNAGFYLLPTVKCPSAKEGRNIQPRQEVIELCAEHYLKLEIEYIRPDCICLLGDVARRGFKWLCTLWGVPQHVVQEMEKPLSEVAGRVFNVRILDKDIIVVPTYLPFPRIGRDRFHKIRDHIRRLGRCADMQLDQDN